MSSFRPLLDEDTIEALKGLYMAATSHVCGVCLQPITVPKGVDPTQVRCPNVDAMWHATYQELLIRTAATKAVIVKLGEAVDALSVIVTTHSQALESTRVAVQEDAQKIAQAIGG